jgi:uncharacterized membrane protein YfcA
MGDGCFWPSARRAGPQPVDLGLTLGLLAGVPNVFAPVLVAYALLTRMPAALMVATFNLTFLFSKSGQIAGFLSENAFTVQALETSLWALPVVLLSLWLGIRLRKRFDITSYERLLRYALWVIALLLITDWAVGPNGIR